MLLIANIVRVIERKEFQKVGFQFGWQNHHPPFILRHAVA
jgi:hypothetical protein